MSKDYFFRVIIELDEEDLADRSSHAFDFPSGAYAIKFAEMAYNSCDIINVEVKIVHNEIDTTNSPMWRNYNGCKINI